MSRYALLCLIAGLSLPGTVLALPGALDCSFGVNGKVNINLGSVEAAKDAALQSTGRLITLGSASGQVRLSRFLANGSLDTSFSGAGSVLYSFSGSSESTSLVIDSQDRIVVAGAIADPDTDVFVARFTSSGAVDTSFGGGDGWVSFDFDAVTSGVGVEQATAVAVDASDRIVLGGYVDPNGNVFHPSNANIAVARLTSSGALDTSFGGGDGLALASSPGTSNDDDARGMGIDALGRIVLVGITYAPNAFNEGPRNAIVVRFSAAGVLDPGFDGDGVRILDMTQSGSDDYGLDVAFSSSGKTLVLGVQTDDPAVARLLDDGSLDPDFGGGDGLVQQSFVGGQDVTEHILVQADDRIMVTGWPLVGNIFHFAAMRFTSAGLRDTSWGSNGVATTAIGFIDRAYAAVLQPDQKLLLAGGVDNDVNLIMARYLNDGQGNNGTVATITGHTPSPSAPGQSISVSYSVSAPGGGTPTGNVTVSDGVDTCTGTVAAGSCSLALGTHGVRSLTATYAGTGCFEPSVSAPVPHTVALVQYAVTPSAGTGGSVTPADVQIVNAGGSTSFSVVPAAGYRIAAVSGCSGVLVGNTYTISNVQQNCSVAASFNRNPVALPGSLSVLEDSGIVAGVLTGNDDDSLVYALASNGGLGNAQLIDSATGAYTYVPSANANGADTFGFTVSDGVVTSAPAAMAVTITPVNDTPGLILAAASIGHPPNAAPLQTMSGFAFFDAGPADEDASQALLEYAVERQDPDGVLAAGASGLSIGNDGTLHYTLTGVGGTATITVRARDNGGIANGGVDLSAPLSFTLSVDRSADLQIAKTDQRSHITPGTTTVYAIVVANAGPNAVTGAQLVDALPASLVGGGWTCVQGLSSATCPSPAAGAGDLSVAVDLPVNGFLRFDVMATVNAEIGSSISNVASIAVPAGIVDIGAANNTATDVNDVVADGLFADGFEQAGAALTVVGAAEALQ